MARHSMNKANREFLARASANPADIAEAAMGSGVLPEYNPRRVGVRSITSLTTPPTSEMSKGPIDYPGLPPKPTLPGSMTGAGLLSATQQTWLQRRALWFASALIQMTGKSLADVTEETAYLAAVGLVGDDYDPLTQGITPGWTNEQWSAAFNYVKNSLGQWYADAYNISPTSKHQGQIQVDSIGYGAR